MVALRLWNSVVQKVKGMAATDGESKTRATVRVHLRHAQQTIEMDSVRYRRGSRERDPWLGKDGEILWSSSRICVAKLVASQTFETFMGFVILGNLLFTILETNVVASCYPDYAQHPEFCPHRAAWLEMCTIGFQVVYTIECALRLMAERTDYLWNKWNLIDLFTTIFGWLGVILSSSAYMIVLRVIRVIRLVRIGRLVISMPELYILLSGMTTSVKPILFGSFTLITVILVWSIVVVELLHPIISGMEFPSCSSCDMAFNGVYSAALTIFSTVVAGDSWGLISIPLAKAEPWTMIILFFIIMTVSIGVLNLILAVIVERAAEARENDHERKQRCAEEQRQKDLQELVLICDRLDHDGSGTLSLQEMLDGFDGDVGFQNLMQRMQLNRTDMETVFRALDDDASGELEYLEFCYHLGTDLSRDPLMLTALSRYCVMEVNTELKMLKATMRDEVQRALDEQRQMLHDQLELFCLIPSCAEAAQGLKQKRSAAPRLKRTSTRPTQLVNLGPQTSQLQKLKDMVQEQRDQGLRERSQDSNDDKSPFSAEEQNQKRQGGKARQQAASQDKQLERSLDYMGLMQCSELQLFSHSLPDDEVYQKMQSHLEYLKLTLEQRKAVVARSSPLAPANLLEKTMDKKEKRVVARKSRDGLNPIDDPPEMPEAVEDFYHFEELVKKFRDHMQREDALHAELCKSIRSISPAEHCP